MTKLRVKLLFAICLVGSTSQAQLPATALQTVSGDSVERLKNAELRGEARTPWMMLRSSSSLMLHDNREQGVKLVLPSITFVANDNLPFGQNDGALWAGKGYNVRAMGGLLANAGALHLIVVPEFVRSSNHPLDIDPTDRRYAPAIPASRSPFSNPFNIYPYSIDLPYRMGDAPVTKIYPGQSSLTLTARALAIGAATENEWWGPAIRNPIVMSDNAPGFPHLFVRTSEPVATRIGLLDARWMTGGLHESDWFDNDDSNDVRSLSSLAFTWSPSVTSPFSAGFTRSVFAPASGYGQTATRWFDVLRNVHHPNARALSDSAFVPGPDQIFSLFGRIVIPSYGLETYIEWGRADFPVSLHDFIEQPIHSRGYTTGAQWILSAGAKGRIRFQGEITSVEQSTTYRFRPQGSFYTSRAVPQGYTNEGQLIGAGIGPGSSGGWLAADYFRRNWQVGLTWGRQRFDNDSFFLLQHANRCGHDVTVYPGARASYSSRVIRLSAAVSKMNRLNTFFQNKESCDSGGEGSDRSSVNLTLTAAAIAF